MKIVKRCSICKEIHGCVAPNHQNCAADCTTAENCEIIKTAKVSELELCPNCTKSRRKEYKLPETVRNFLSG
jgi:hypothetical protein